MKSNKWLYFLLLQSLLLVSSCKTNGEIIDNGNSTLKDSATLYVTTGDQSMLFHQQKLSFNNTLNTSTFTLTIDPTVRYQQLDGFGAAFTGSTCYNLMKMPAEKRTALLKDTFDPIAGMGYSYIRISIGCSDFSLSEYTYCDTPGIQNFAIQKEEKEYIFPILKEILKINPEIKILASPWTPPRWMKVNNLTDLQPFNSWTSGQLNPAFYQDYATYFVKYIKAMEAEGFKIEAITIQNEPLNRGNSASMFMTWQEQRDFIKTALGPKFSENGITTKILAYDHNYDYDAGKADTGDQKQYPTNIYADANAAKYIDGAAYHAYGGDKRELLNIHNANPGKNLYFTEISIGLWNYNFREDLMWNVREVGIGTINNWSKAVIVWNFMLDENHAPFRPGGCNECLGAVTVSSTYNSYSKNSHYYDIAHLSKVIRPGAFRIKITGTGKDGLYYTAVENPDGSFGVVLLNDTDFKQNIQITDTKSSFTYGLPARAVVSFAWKQRM